MQDHTTQQPPRRTKVKDRRGLYYRDLPGGRRRYEITYLDSDGRRRWEVVEGNLRDAEAKLDSIKDRRRKGERVAPTKATFTDVANAWLDGQAQLRPKTIRTYRWALDVHVIPRLGRLRIASVNEDDVAGLISGMVAAGYRPWTIRAVLTPLSRVLGHAARRGMIASNPVRKLEVGERPALRRGEMRILTREEIGKLLSKADPPYRPILATAIFTGLRLSELLALQWSEISFGDGTVHVRKQLDGKGNRVDPKTPQAIRDVVMMPSLAKVLREHKLASLYKRPTDFVFASATGGPLDGRNVSQRGKDEAIKRAKLEADGQPRLTMHQLRHSFASLLIAQGANVTFVSRQLGHVDPSITLKVYAHLFDGAEHAQRASDLLEAGFGNLLETSHGNQGENESAADGTEVAPLREIGVSGN